MQTVSSSGKKNLTKIILYIIAIGVSLLWLLPMIWVVLVSFKPSGSNVMDATTWFKPPFNLANYHYVFSSQPILLWVWNSFVIASITTLFVLLLSAMAAFPFSQNRFPGDRILFILILIGMMVPGEALLIPLYTLFRDLNLLDSSTSLILPSIAVPFGMLMLKQFFDGLPKDLYEAAKIDGCSVYRILISIVLPLARPSLAALGIFTFLGSWNNFLWPFISITSPENMTVPTGIPFFLSSYNADYTIPMAANIIVSIPVLIVFLIFQKQIIKGISFTGLK